ncbi:unnamed protein product [Arabis nemorensis]|uniref:RNase H type-1 domain-containing protein n=1 Tax=Arabis nemorensis TaxID=586526 RepID=A0A565ASL7_9BRAS|nr:unnamed protein product [Arabis nemorensis]
MEIPKHKIWVKKRWTRPPDPWLKCNIGVDWSKGNNRMGASWILRNSDGHVLLHSRRGFSDICSIEEAKIQAHLWVFESMVAHKLTKVLFATCAAEFVNALNRFQAWPSFTWHVVEFQLILNRMKD